MRNDLIKQFEDNKRKPDDTFRFHCTQCGKCCINREDILLSAKDIFHIAKKLNLTTVELVNKYGEAYIGEDSRLPIVRLKSIGSEKRCPLLKGRKCAVHNVKPDICAMFPLGRASVCITDIQSNPDAKKEYHTEYFFTDPKCGDNKETHTVRDWLTSFGIPLEDEVFTMWQQTLIALHHAIVTIENILSEEAIRLFWDRTLVFLYLNYDTTKEFLPQFKENMAKLQELASLLYIPQKDPYLILKREGIMNKQNQIDWIIHYVFGDAGPGDIINSHTHGMEKYGHLDFQVVLPLPPKHICYLLNTLGKRVQAGEKYLSGDLVYGIYEDCPIRLEEFRETNRDVLRLIIPDKNNLFPDHPDCQAKYKVQLNHAFEY